MSESVAAWPLSLRARSRFACWAAYAELAKPRLTLLSVLSVLLSYYLAPKDSFDIFRFSHVFLGAFLVGAGANSLNQFYEKERDAKMKRTEARPLPSGRLTEEQAFDFGVFLSVTGVMLFLCLVNPSSAIIAFLTLLCYLIFYTPLKPKTPFALFAGAVTGALPPVMGWASAVNSVSAPGCWALFLILFCWQIPHFLAIGWMHREDYERAGFPLLTDRGSRALKTARREVFYTILLVTVSFLPRLTGLSGNIYLAAALILGFVFLFLAAVKNKYGRINYARRLFLASIFYLPLLMTFMAWDKR